MLHDNFIKTAKQESHEFKALLNILSSLNLHTKEGRKLLCVLNNIIDYYINREVEYSDDVKMPIVYFPLCEDWAQMLCEEFVALKMSLLWGKSTRTNILSSYKSKPFIYLPEKVNKKEREACLKSEMNGVGDGAVMAASPFLLFSQSTCFRNRWRGEDKNVKGKDKIGR